MASGLLEPPAGGEPLGVFLLRGEEEEEERRREVGCQWESPEEERREEERREEEREVERREVERREVEREVERREVERREVGCQSDSAERRDAAVQVDLLTQQLSWRHTGSSAMLLQCFAVRPDGPDGGALLQHCTTNPTTTRTRPIKPSQSRTRTIKPSQSRSQRRPPPQRSNAVKHGPSLRRYRRLSTDIQQEEEEEEEEEVVEEEEVEEEEVEEEVEEDTGDPTWSPPEGAVNLEALQLDSDSQHAPVCSVKLEPDSTVCEVCGKVMKNKSSLARHSFIHTGRKPFACHLCELRFNRRDNLQHHLTRLHPMGVAKLERRRPLPAWLCAACGKTFSCRSRLKTHEVIHSGVKPHGCDLCPKAYMRTNDLEHHRKVAHAHGAAPPQPSSLLCDLCGREFKCRSQLLVHFQTHTGERPHLCDVCGRKFSRQYQLQRHKLLLHAGRAAGEPSAASPFSCGVCGKRLQSAAQLAAHGRVHSGERPHRCSLCLRGFQRAACLKQHHLRMHLRARGGGEAGGEAGAGRRRGGAAGAAAFPCPVCSKVFRFRSLLASHALVHSDSRPYACDFCSRSFRRLSHLKRHREVLHAGGRSPQSFVCGICGKDKKCRSQLARHVVVHTGERPFGCERCAARFNRRGNLQQHMRRMHGLGAAPAEEATPILFDDDVTPALTYKQEETVVAVDDAEVVTERAQSS